MPYFKAILADVDRVYTNPVLRQFWRTGELVANRARLHPYQENLPPEYAGVDRWFLLNADVNPKPAVWTPSQPIAVYAAGFGPGGGARRRWLVYAHSPLENRRGVKLAVPEYGLITVDVSRGGDFYLVEEERSTCSPLTTGPRRSEASK